MTNVLDVTILDDFLTDQEPLFRSLVSDIEWKQRTPARKTASLGVLLDGGGDEGVPFPPLIERLADTVAAHVGWQPNSCVLDYYTQRRSNMGIHTDAVDRLESGTGIAIVSLGAPRMMVFERSDGGYMCGRELKPGSLLVMDLDTPRDWRHGVPARPLGPRISATFRRVSTDEAVARTG